MAQLTFFYDLSSPWTYLAFNNVQEVIVETQATVSWRPFLVGGVFNAVNQSVYAARSNQRTPKSSITSLASRVGASRELTVGFPDRTSSSEVRVTHAHVLRT